MTLASDEHRVAYPLPSGLNEVWIRPDCFQPPDGTWTPWPVLRVNFDRAWSDGRTVLIGDAAHAMPPYAAQGGAMALEDASVLAALLAKQTDSPGAIAAYERERRPRIARIAALTEANRQIYHHDGLMRIARNAAMRLSPQVLVQRRMDFVYSWRPPTVRSG